MRLDQLYRLGLHISVMLRKHEKDIIFDRYGSPRLLIMDSDHIRRGNGTDIGVLHGNRVYNYTGRQVGWYENGILRDMQGYTAGFGVEPTDNPMPFLPIKQPLALFRLLQDMQVPMPGVLSQFKPIPPTPTPSGVDPEKHYGWSVRDIEELFR